MPVPVVVGEPPPPCSRGCKSKVCRLDKDDDHLHLELRGHGFAPPFSVDCEAILMVARATALPPSKPVPSQDPQGFHQPATHLLPAPLHQRHRWAEQNRSTAFIFASGGCGLVHAQPLAALGAGWPLPLNSPRQRHVAALLQARRTCQGARSSVAVHLPS